MVKRCVKWVLRVAGLDVRRLSTGSGLSFVPFVRDIQCAGHKFKIWITSDIVAAWYTSEKLAAEAETHELLGLVSPGGNVLEVGSHHGVYALLLAEAMGAAGRVIGVEANAETAIVANANTAINDACGRVRILHAAGGKRSGDTVAITRCHCAEVSEVPGPDDISVDVVAGDDLDREYGPFDLVKIDVEGFEGNVLEGCCDLIARVPNLALEVHGPLLQRYGWSVQRLFELIPLENYEGTMVFRDDARAVVPLDVSRITDYTVVNLFLRARSGAIVP